jgi:lipopolysaccharide/colanic/teichoic acid biosynthesis glycosyltransferase
MEVSLPAQEEVVTAGRRVAQLPANDTGLKRIFDLVVGLALGVFFLPVLITIALILKITHPELPVVFGVTALGKDRKIFREWKFSTMVLDAHLKLEEVLSKDATLRLEWEENHKLVNDPRILPGIGKFLRKTSLNELPQLWNVICGEMSLVGPRAITAKEQEIYGRIAGPEGMALRFTVRPGVTGLWQVERKDEISYEERVKLDREYILAQSMLMDIRIMLKTALKIVRPSGAY